MGDEPSRHERRPSAGAVTGTLPSQNGSESAVWRRVMVPVETKRLVLRGFRSNDWPQVLELAIDWKAAPGPESDKLPTTEAECRKFTDYLTSSGNYYAMCLRTD